MQIRTAMHLRINKLQTNFKQKTNNRSKNTLPRSFDLWSQKQNNMHFRDLIISIAVKAELLYWLWQASHSRMMVTF